uniref:Apple domain-containing protein n=2 Tax=Clytia hemisphaerica TaxID=252671 RepID=A0A7M5WZY7_9CNID
NGISASQCVINCAASIKCRSVNYHGGSQTCELLEQSSSNDGEHLIVEAKGWIHFEKSKPDQSIIPEGDYINKTEEFHTAKGKVIHKIHVFPKEWKLSLKVLVKNDDYSKMSPLLHFESSSYDFLFSIGMRHHRKLYISITTPTFGRESLTGKKDVRFGEWMWIKVSLCSFLGKWMLYWTIDDVVQTEHTVQGWDIFTDVKVEASKERW